MPTNYLVIGAGRSGTTSLHRHVGQHPDLIERDLSMWLDEPSQ